MIQAPKSPSGDCKVSICSHTVVRDGAEFIKPVLEQVLPYVTRALISIDERSSDGTVDIIKKLQKEHDNMEVSFFKHDDCEGVGLTTEKNEHIKRTTEKWVWHLDDDEYWPTDQIEGLMARLKRAKDDERGFAVRPHALAAQ